MTLGNVSSRAGDKQPAWPSRSNEIGVARRTRGALQPWPLPTVRTVEGTALHTIDQFMWGYQTHFRAHLGFLANRVLERIGAGDEAHALLVGSLLPTARARHLVCVEPEDGQLTQA